MNIYVFTDTSDNKVTIVHAATLDRAWGKYILKRYPVMSANESPADLRKDLEHDVIVNDDVDNII